jgi:hypothetical protein
LFVFLYACDDIGDDNGDDNGCGENACTAAIKLMEKKVLII